MSNASLDGPTGQASTEVRVRTESTPGHFPKFHAAVTAPETSSSFAAYVVTGVMVAPLVVSDAVASGLVVSAITYLTSWLSGSLHATPAAMTSGAVVASIVGLSNCGAYAIGLGPIREYFRIVRAFSVVFLMASAFIGIQAGIVPALCMAAGIPFAVVASMSFRALARFRLARSSWWGIPVFVVDTPATAATSDLIRKNPKWGLRPVLLIDRVEELEFGNKRPSGWMQTAKFAAARLLVEESLVSERATRHRNVYSVPSRQFPSLHTDVTEFGRDICFAVRKSHLSNPLVVLLKRCLDVVLSAALLVCTAPFIATLAILVRLSSEGPILFGQERVGRGGRPFKVWKFRTMVCNAEAVLAEYLESNPAMKSEWESDHKLRHDPRVTVVGRFLRKTSLDELPQLWNVLVGEMSLVGPRPIVDDVRYDRTYIEDFPDVFDSYQQVRPGVTGLWQVSGRNLTSYEERVAFDRYYLSNWSLSLDFYILLRTAKTVLLREGAF